MRIKRIYAPEGIRGTGHRQIPLSLDADDGPEDVGELATAQRTPIVRMTEHQHGVLCMGAWGTLLVPWAKITTVVYAVDGDRLRATEPAMEPGREDASWPATGMPREERVDPLDVPALLNPAAQDKPPTTFVKKPKR
jgi:hypothetical protein